VELPSVLSNKGLLAEAAAVELLPVENLVLSVGPHGVGGLSALGTKVGLGPEMVRLYIIIKFKVDLVYSGKMQVLHTNLYNLT
jgi:hypothetical protein